MWTLLRSFGHGIYRGRVDEQRVANHMEEMKPDQWSIKYDGINYDQWRATDAFDSDYESTLLDESNQAWLEKEMNVYVMRDEIRFPYKRIEIRVWRKDGKFTKCFERFCEVLGWLEDNPCLDEDDLYRREEEATMEEIKSTVRRFYDDTLDLDDSAEKVWEFLREYYEDELEPVGGNGAYPDEARIKEALYYLGLCPDYDLEDTDKGLYGETVKWHRDKVLIYDVNTDELYGAVSGDYTWSELRTACKEFADKHNAYWCGIVS